MSFDSEHDKLLKKLSNLYCCDINTVRGSLAHLYQRAKAGQRTKIRETSLKPPQRALFGIDTFSCTGATSRNINAGVDWMLTNYAYGPEDNPFLESAIYWRKEMVNIEIEEEGEEWVDIEAENFDHKSKIMADPDDMLAFVPREMDKRTSSIFFDHKEGRWKYCSDRSFGIPVLWIFDVMRVFPPYITFGVQQDLETTDRTWIFSHPDWRLHIVRNI